MGGGIGPARIPHSKSDCHRGVWSELNAIFLPTRKGPAWPAQFDFKALVKCIHGKSRWVEKMGEVLGI